MTDETAKKAQRLCPADNRDEADYTSNLIDISSEPPRDIQDTPIATPSLEEFPAAIRAFRADTKPNVDAMPEEVRTAAIFERHVAQKQLILFQSVEQQIIYHPLPYRPSPGDALLPECPWRIILELRVETLWMRLGLDLYAEVTLGRGESRDGYVMVNLNPYGASIMGVSRAHLALCPAVAGLVAVDLNSTNGTTINGDPIPPETEMLMPDRCEIMLSKMKLSLYIIERPG